MTVDEFIIENIELMCLPGTLTKMKPKLVTPYFPPRIFAAACSKAAETTESHSKNL